MSFAQLYLLLQYAMGFHNEHLYKFSYEVNGDEQIGIPTRSIFSPAFTDSRFTKIEDFLNTENPKMFYTYDFGDNWLHTIKLEKVLTEAPHKLSY